MSKNKLYRTDCCLLVLFPLVFASGAALHAACHGFIAVGVRAAAIVHALIGAMFVVAAAVHVKEHWGWYKSLRKTMRGHDAATSLLNLLFTAAAVTGIVLLVAVDSAFSHIGMLHYRLGIVLTLFAAYHFGKRFARFRKMK